MLSLKKQLDFCFPKAFRLLTTSVLNKLLGFLAFSVLCCSWWWCQGALLILEFPKGLSELDVMVHCIDVFGPAAGTGI